MGIIEKIITSDNHDSQNPDSDIYKWTCNFQNENKFHGEYKIVYKDFLLVLEKQEGWEKQTVYDNDNISISAKSIFTLADFIKNKQYKELDYQDVEKLIMDIGSQMVILKKYKKGLFFMNLEDIIVINERFFLLNSLEHVLNIDKKHINNNEQIKLTYPITFSKFDKQFLAPELYYIGELPFISSISVGYYSLAKLCIFCLGLGDNIEPLMGSKMYYFLERCLETEPKDRFFLYI